MRCITCLHPFPHLYTTHTNASLPSGDNLRLTRCERCGNVADKYVEHDFVVLFIDLVLVKLGAYRHVWWNVLGVEEEDGKGDADGWMRGGMGKMVGEDEELRLC